MGFFDKLLSAIGFENEDEAEVITKQKKEKKQKQTLTAAKFDLSQEKESESKELSRFGVAKKEQSEEDLKVYSPDTQTEIEQILLRVKNGENVLLNLTNFSDDDRVRALDFISGALFVMNKTIKRVENNLFMISNK